MPQNTRKPSVKEPKIKSSNNPYISGAASGAKKSSSTAIDDFFQRLELSIEKNSKKLITIAAVIIIAVGGYFGYKYLIQAPKEEKAATALSFSQQWFDVDSFGLVLNGDGMNGGALSVIKKYSGTKAANLAKFYAGVSYLNQNDPQNAIKYLADFKGEGTPVQFMAYGALGDAYMESKNVDKGIEFYQKAAAADNDFISPLYLFRAGLASELNGKKDQAIKFYKQVKNDYPRSQQAQDIDKYLARAGDVSLD